MKLSLDPFGKVQYILSYFTKGQKKLIPFMDHACREAKNGKMDLKSSVRLMGNTFLNEVPITRMSIQVIFLHCMSK